MRRCIGGHEKDVRGVGGKTSLLSKKSQRLGLILLLCFKKAPKKNSARPFFTHSQHAPTRLLLIDDGDIAPFEGGRAVGLRGIALLLEEREKWGRAQIVEGPRASVQLGVV